MTARTVSLIVGGTGAMGSHVARMLATDTGREVRALTRDPSSARSRALMESSHGLISTVRGNLDDEASLRDALDGVDEVFCNTDFFSTASPLDEYEQGLRALRAAERAGVDRFVWSSLDNAAVITGGSMPVPHYDAKAAVESFIALHRSEEMMRGTTDGWYSHHVAVLVTAPYFENLYDFAPARGELPDGREGLLFSLPLGEGGKWPFIALDDIAFFARHLLDHWRQWAGRTLKVAAEALTGAEIASVFERATGIPSGYQSVDPSDLAEMLPDIGHDLAAMFSFFQTHDIFADDRDLSRVRAIHPSLETFTDWLRRTAWDGSPRR